MPWLKDSHRDAHSQPFTDLATAWQRVWTDQNKRPVFKKKRKTRDSFDVANDQFRLHGPQIKRPKIGWVVMQEPLRFPGKILGARVPRQAEQGFFSVPVDVPSTIDDRHRTAQGITGVDVGANTLATLPDGEKIAGPQPHRKALRRLKMRQRAISRKMVAAKAAIDWAPKAPGSPEARTGGRLRTGWRTRICAFSISGATSYTNRLPDSAAKTKR